MQILHLLTFMGLCVFLYIYISFRTRDSKKERMGDIHGVMCVSIYIYIYISFRKRDSKKERMGGCRIQRKEGRLPNMAKRGMWKQKKILSDQED